jgi:hypothetical protein
MWEIQGEPEHLPGGGADYDGVWWKWWLRRGTVQSFTVVKVPAHALVKPDTMTERTAEAVDSRGLTEVERYMDCALSPRVIELATSGHPRVTHRGSPAQEGHRPEGWR